MTPRGSLPSTLAAVIALLLVGATSVAAQDRGTVEGTVVDAGTEEPLRGVQVYIDGTQRGALTDAEGRFTISEVRAGTRTVVAQLIGYRTAREQVAVQAGQVVAADFRMAEQALRLDEVVATGVVDPVEGRRVPFSVGSLSADQLPVPTTHSALAALQGKVAGVTIARGSGQPGTGISILLRSPTSIVRNNTPLFVVDGVTLRQTSGAGTMDIEALDIERIEVIKGAAAAAMYGSRAAAGVVSITTRSGAGLTPGETAIRYRTELGYSDLPGTVEMAQHHHYQVDEQNRFVDQFGNVTENPSEFVIAEDRIMDKPYGVPLYDNLGAFYQPGGFNTHSLSVAHNTETSNYVLSLNNYREKGNIVTMDGYERNNFRLNVDQRIGETFTLGARAYHNRSWRENLTGDPFWDLLMYPPYVDLSARDEEGNFAQQPHPTVFRENPIWRLESRDNREERGRTLLSTQGQWRPIDWLRFAGNISYDQGHRRSQIYVPLGTPFVSSTDEDAASDGRLQYSEMFDEAINADVSATALWSIGDVTARTTFRAMAERDQYHRTTADGRDFFVRDIRSLDATDDQRIGSFLSDVRSLGYFVNTGFDYRGRYIWDALIRRDGSSLFGPEERWHNYYRVSAAYRIAEEPWWPLAGITEFKPRFSYGTAGGRPNFSDQFETWSVSSSGAVSKGTLGNRFLRPEHNAETEVGLDIEFLGRYLLELTYARQVTSDQIIQLPQPAYSGYSNQWGNAGTITGQTYEATLEGLLVQRPNFSWTATVIADRSSSVITEWERVCYITSSFIMRCGGSNRSEIWGDRFIEGMDLPAFHAGSEQYFDVNDDGYLVAVGPGGSWRDGNWGTTVEVDGRTYDWGMPILDRDEDGGTIVQPIGEGFPDANLGLINQVRWGGLATHMHWHANIGGQVYNRTRQRLYQHFRHADLDQAGKPQEEKKPLDYYQLLYNTNNPTNEFVEDASFLKLRELHVGYTPSTDLLDRIGLGGLGLDRVTVALIGRNLLTLSPYSGFDPEHGTMVRHDNFGWPLSRTLTASLEVQF